MATLPTLLPTGNGTSPRAWTTQAFGSIAEGIAAADGTVIGGLNNTNNNDTSFLFTPVPADFVSITTLSWRVRYAQAGRSNDTIGLAIRVVDSLTGIVLAGADALGGFSTVDAAITATTLANSAVTAFAYVNTSVSRKAWQRSQIELRQTWTTSGPADGVHATVDAVELTGTYVASTQPVRVTMYVAGASAGSATSVVTGSWTPDVSSTLLAVITGSSIGLPVCSGISGNSVTWTEITRTNRGDSSGALYVFRASGVGATAGAVTITWDINTSNTQWAFLEVDGCAAVGATTVIQSVANSGTGTTGTVTLATLLSPFNASFLATFKSSAENISPEANYQELADGSSGSNTRQVEFNPAAETTPSCTWTTSEKWCSIGLELRALIFKEPQRLPVLQAVNRSGTF